MAYDTRRVSAPDGRSIEVVTLGRESRPTVVTHHGTPGSASAAEFYEALAGDFFVVGLSRPGYGASTRHEGRDVAAAVSDVATVLDALGRDDYLSVGWSGGGPHALACAALGAPRCRAAWSLAGVVPMSADIDFTAGMGPENVEEFALALKGGPEHLAALVADARRFSGATPDTVIGLFGGLLSDVDTAALADDAARAALARTMVEAFSSGHWGYYDDDRAMVSPWGFDVEDIAVPVAIWYGDHDLMVPPTHGEWLGAHVPGARVVHDPAEGHISVVTRHLDRLGSELAAAS